MKTVFSYILCICASREHTTKGLILRINSLRRRARRS